jgi:hypothetical protein
MRTPREILLARHHAAEPKLDALTRDIVKHLDGSARAETPAGPGSLLARIFHDLFANTTCGRAALPRRPDANTTCGRAALPRRPDIRAKQQLRPTES